MKKTISNTQLPVPILKTIEQMSKFSGLGINTLRRLMAAGELEYVIVGNRRLISDSAIFDWYERNKIAVLREVK